MLRNGYMFLFHTINSNEHIKQSRSFSYNRCYWQKIIHEICIIRMVFKCFLTLNFYLNFSYFGKRKQYYFISLLIYNDFFSFGLHISIVKTPISVRKLHVHFFVQVIYYLVINQNYYLIGCI